jgi:hypothetical protein
LHHGKKGECNDGLTINLRYFAHPVYGKNPRHALYLQLHTDSYTTHVGVQLIFSLSLFQDNSMKIQTLISTVILALTGTAFAQTATTAATTTTTATPRIDKREAHQQSRIAKGIQSGQLTAKEAAHLEKREAKIDADEAAAKADGKVTRKERRKLRHEQDRASAAIHKQKHDAQMTAPASK